jgi:hypothetical protein
MSARDLSTSCPNPFSENCAPSLPATLRTTIAQHIALGNSQQMVLPTGPRDHDEIVLIEAIRIFENGPRDSGIEIEGEGAHDLARRLADCAEPLRQFLAGPPLEVPRKPQDDLVEHLDMIFLELFLLLDEQARETAKRILPPCRVSTRDRLLDLGHEGQHGHATAQLRLASE